MKNKKIKVSVIMPIYNVAKYLKQAIESVLNQTLKEIEIICVNDGSTDNSLEIIKEYQCSDSRIKIIDKKNTGYGDSMNIGIQSANGEYVGIVEPDDFVSKKMFKTLYKVAKKYDADVVKSNFYEIDTTKNERKFIQVATNVKYYNKKLTSENKEVFSFVMNNWTGIFKKDFLKIYNILHNTTSGASFQDTGFWFQSLLFAKAIVFVNKEFYYHRIDNPNSSINNTNKVYCICDEFDYINKILKKHNLYKKYEDVFLGEKFKHYLYSYFRINKEYRLEFLEKIKNEFKDCDISKISTYLSKFYIEKLNLILKNIETFNKVYKDKSYNYFINQSLKTNEKFLIRTIKKIKIYGIKNYILMHLKENKRRYKC